MSNRNYTGLSDIYGSIRDSMMYDILMGTSNMRFLWLLDETSGATAADATGNSRTGTYDGVTLNQYIAGWKTIRSNYYRMRVVKFDGVNDLITPAAGCSVRGLASVTLAFIFEVPPATAIRRIWDESTGDNADTGRFILQLDATNILTFSCRSGLAAQTASTITTNAALSAGVHLLHATVDVATDAMSIYLDGAALATTGVPDFGADTIFVDTAPLGLTMGRYTVAAPRWYLGGVGLVAQWSAVLTAAQCLAQAKAGGFA